MKDLFERYLISRGYSLDTPSGNNSTVYQYLKHVENVKDAEGEKNWKAFSEHIDNIVELYSPGGVKEDAGKKSNSTCINALRAFQMFTKEDKKIRKLFEDYLVFQGYSAASKNGNPGTIYSYQRAVIRIKDIENKSWKEFISDIDSIVSLYSAGGLKETEGRASNNTVINALKSFKNFTSDTDCVGKVYKKYLNSGGYSQSTIENYSREVENVRILEGKTWIDFALEIEEIIALYSIGGLKENDGTRSHNILLSSLKSFKKYLEL